MRFRASMDAMKEIEICCSLQRINHESEVSFCWDWQLVTNIAPSVV
jgi:hypothetical protein